MKSMTPIINIRQLLDDEKLLRIIEIDLEKGIKYIIRSMNGSLTELKDIESFRKFLEDRNIK